MYHLQEGIISTLSSKDFSSKACSFLSQLLNFNAESIVVMIINLLQNINSTLISTTY